MSGAAAALSSPCHMGHAFVEESPARDGAVPHLREWSLSVPRDDEAYGDDAGAGPCEAAEDEVTLFGQRVVERVRERVHNGPCARFGHTAVVHGDTMVVFGGRKDSMCFNDVWTCAFPSKTWQRRECAAAAAPPQNGPGFPTARAGHTAVCYEGAMYVFGGVDEDGVRWFNDLWKLDLCTWEWVYMRSASELFRPEARKGHTATVYRGKMYVFGGGVDGAEPLVLHNDLWELDFNTGRWMACNYNGQIPEPRMYHTAVLQPDGRMVIFGGRVERDIGFVNDTMEIDLNHMTARELLVRGGVPPNPRMCSTAVLHHRTMAVFTGGAYSYLEDSHELDLDTMQWRPVPAALEFGGRTRPTTVLWKDTLFTFGGCVTSNAYVDDYVEIQLRPLPLQRMMLRWMGTPRLLNAFRHDIKALPPSLAAALGKRLRQVRLQEKDRAAALAPCL